MKPSLFHECLRKLLEAEGWVYHPANQGYHHEAAGLAAHCDGGTSMRIETVHDQGGTVRHARTTRRNPESAAQDVAEQTSMIVSELFPNVEPAP